MKKINIYAVCLLLAVIAPLAARSQEFAKLSKEEKDKILKGEIIYKSVKAADSKGNISGYG